MINSAELKPQSGPEIRRLVEIKTVDEKGVVKARVVAEYEPTDTEGQKSSSESAGGAKRYQDDDEDSTEISSGDSEAYGESYDMVANDYPMAQNQSESSGLQPKSSNSSINSTLKPTDPKSSTVLPTTGQTNAPNQSLTTTRETTKLVTTTAVPQTKSPDTTAGTKATVTTGKQIVTTLSTLSPSTKDMQNDTTTFPPKVTEVETTAQATTTTSSRTTTAAPKPTIITQTTESNVSESTPFEASTTARPQDNKNKTILATKASVTTSIIVDNSDVRGQKGPERKRKTLFGFVTVEILIALLAGALFSVLLVAFLVYRLKKRNEGSYELSETIALRPKEIDEMGKKKEVFV